MAAVLRMSGTVSGQGGGSGHSGDGLMRPTPVMLQRWLGTNAGDVSQQFEDFAFPLSGAKWHSRVYSEPNLTCFLTYISCYVIDPNMIKELEQIPIVDHKIHEDDFFAGLDIPDSRPYAKTSTGVSWEMKSIPCNIPDCERCRKGMGGWAFRWESPRWTPKLAIGDPEAPANRMQARKNCMDAPWPEGFLRPPRPLPPSATKD